MTTTVTTATATAATRPAAFDARVMKYHKLLWQFAKRHQPTDTDKQEELVQATIARALEKWELFREDGSFTNWLRFLMLQLLNYERKHKGRVFVSDDVLAFTGTPPTQEVQVDAALVLARIKDSKILCRLACGDRQFEIAQEEGVSRAAVSQRYLRQRAKYLAGMIDEREEKRAAA